MCCYCALQAFQMLQAAIQHPDGIDYDLTPLLKHLPAWDLNQVGMMCGIAACMHASP
jgi:hypothetical protein